MSAPTVLAVDGNSLLHRSFHSQAASGLRGTDGAPIWAVRGVVSQLVAAIERVDPDGVVVGFDDPDASERRVRWPQYKATRAEKAPALISQLRLCAQMLGELGLSVLVPPGLEADDVLASTAARAAALGGHCVVMTSDRDSFALINESTTVLRILNGGIEASPMLTPSRLELLLGIRPEQYRDYAALRGDASDNLDGVSGIGAKTAAKLLRSIPSVGAAFADLEDGGKRVTAAIGPKATARLSAAGARESWELNCAVMAMRADLAVDLTRGRLPLDPEDVRTVFERLALTWSVPKALRVLARVDADPITPDAAAHTSYGGFAADRGFLAARVRPGTHTRPSYGGVVDAARSVPRRSHPPLRARDRDSDQLSLF